MFEKTCYNVVKYQVAKLYKQDVQTPVPRNIKHHENHKGYVKTV